MTARSTLVLALGACLLLSAGAGPLRAQEDSAAQLHVRHVLESFEATPEGEGLLPTAEAEAATAARHAGLAANDNTNLPWMQRHALHVLHAVDPSRVEEGPGLGFGVLQAAEGIADHIQLAEQADGATENIRTHATHAGAAASAVAERAATIADLAERVGEASDYTSAGSLIQQISYLARGLTSGIDGNRDDEITWEGDEGGLEHVRRHVELMAGSESPE